MNMPEWGVFPWVHEVTRSTFEAKLVIPGDGEVVKFAEADEIFSDAGNSVR